MPKIYMRTGIGGIYDSRLKVVVAKSQLIVSYSVHRYNPWT